MRREAASAVTVGGVRVVRGAGWCGRGGGAGVRLAVGVGYGLAEITGLAWAGCIPVAEAARLVVQCGQVLRACASGTAAMARVTADAETARVLGAAGRLHIAAYEGPRTHVLAGTTAGIRELTWRDAVLGVPVEVLDGGRGPPRCTPPAWPGAPPRCGACRGHELRPATPAADLHDHRPPGYRGGRHGAAAGRAGHPAGAVRPGDGAGGRGRRPDRNGRTRA